jgi:hypothetical protein
MIRVCGVESLYGDESIVHNGAWETQGTRMTPVSSNSWLYVAH